MTGETLSYINSVLTDELEIPYAFMEWQDDPPEAYFVGEYSEGDTPEEDGCQEITFIIDGFTRGSWFSLEKYKQKIEQNIERTAILASGAGVAVFYGNASPVPTGDADLKRIQINLTIKEYKNGR
ncbi:hypothetical protein DXB01_09940 [Clostridium sp. OF10-22XD]|jgi:hypothetical protein|nr:hypothetical protein DXB01_09940 [Clostridium sp. OF10-22XD]DAJ88036.1 MAG TPA: hypothetical protein [Caudoviricetes sp.]